VRHSLAGQDQFGAPIDVNRVRRVKDVVVVFSLGDPDAHLYPVHPAHGKVRVEVVRALPREVGGCVFGAPSTGLPRRRRLPA